MDKQSMKSKAYFCQKQSNIPKNQNLQTLLHRKQQQQTKHPPLRILQQQLYFKRSKTLNVFSKYFNWLSFHLNYNLFPLWHEMLTLKICIFLTSLGAVSSVQAQSTVLPPIMQICEGGRLVCIATNETRTSCIKYVNSSIYGLVELNESIYPALKIFRGNYNYQMIARINPFWLRFEPPSDVSFYVMGILYTVIFVVGFSGNGLVIYMFSRCKALRTVSNILVFNLALCDFMIIIKCPIAAYNNFMRGPVLGDWGCRLYGFLGGFSGCASIGMLTVISMDRYSVVVHPFGLLQLNNKNQYYYWLLSLAWFEAFFFSVIPLLEVDLSVYVPEGYLTTCSFDYLDKAMPARVFMFLFFIFAWCLPLTIICYCYFHILRSVATSKNIQSNRNKHQVEVRLAYIVLLVIGLWFLAWTPYSIVAMMGVFGWDMYLTPTISMIPALFCKIAACLNPFLYTISHKRFRNELQRLFCKRKPIYQYSATRSSCIIKSSRRIQNRIENSSYDLNSTIQSKNLKTTYVIKDASIDEIVRSSPCNSEDISSSVFHYPMHQKKKSFSKKQKINPTITPESAGIFILELEESKNLNTPPLETNF